MKPGILYTTFYLPENIVNNVAGQGRDADPICPEYKRVAVDGGKESKLIARSVSKMIVSTVLLVLPILMCGCVTPPPNNPNPSLGVPKPDSSVICVVDDIYDQAALGSEVVKIDGQAKGKLRRRQYCWVEVPPGRHVVSMGDPAVDSHHMASRVLVVGPGEQCFLRYRYDLSVPRSDGQLLAEILGGRTSSNPTHNSQDLTLMAKDEALALLKRSLPAEWSLGAR